MVRTRLKTSPYLAAVLTAIVILLSLSSSAADPLRYRPASSHGVPSWQRGFRGETTVWLRNGRNVDAARDQPRQAWRTVEAKKGSRPRLRAWMRTASALQRQPVKEYIDQPTVTPLHVPILDSDDPAVETATWDPRHAPTLAPTERPTSTQTATPTVIPTVSLSLGLAKDVTGTVTLEPTEAQIPRPADLPAETSIDEPLPLITPSVQAPTTTPIPISTVTPTHDSPTAPSLGPTQSPPSTDSLIPNTPEPPTALPTPTLLDVSTTLPTTLEPSNSPSQPSTGRRNSTSPIEATDNVMEPTVQGASAWPEETRVPPSGVPSPAVPSSLQPGGGDRTGTAGDQYDEADSGAGAKGNGLVASTGMGMGAKVGVGAAAGLGLVALLVVGMFVLKNYQRSEQELEEDSHNAVDDLGAASVLPRNSGRAPWFNGVDR